MAFLSRTLDVLLFTSSLVTDFTAGRVGVGVSKYLIQVQMRCVKHNFKTKLTSTDHFNLFFFNRIRNANPRV